MTTKVLTESVVEEAAIAWFRGLDYQYLPGPDIACDGPYPERRSYADVVLEERLRSALVALNPDIPAEALEDVFRKITRLDSPSLIVNNRQFHKILTEGVDVEYHNEEGRIVGDKVWLVDFADPESNDWLVVNQFTVIEGQQNRRPDLVVFVNCLPHAGLDLKNPADENSTIMAA